jgi:class 3 adenylate cyclase/predicted ATPase
VVRCSSCGSENPESARFCNQCAASLLSRCPACGVLNRASAKFCGECGTPLEVAPLAAKSPAGTHFPLRREQPIAPGASLEPQGIDGERRHLSVLFCDLVGSTEIAAHLDPEDWREIVANYHKSAAEAVARFGGHVAQYLGDGLLVFFGYPQAHEDDPERAVRAGLAILDAISMLNGRPSSERRPKLAARIGIHCGAVVVGEGQGKGANVFGNVPNVASRVQSAAAPDTVLITADVHQLVSGLFVVDDRGAKPLKGIEHPVQLYRVIQSSGVRGRLAVAALRGLTPFIGREDELRLLLHRWDQTREGEGQVVMVVGEAGIGKSRLVKRFHEEIARTPHTWVDAAAAALYQNTPFFAIADTLQQGFRSRHGEDNTDERVAELEASLQLAGVKLIEAVPLIAPLMNLAIPAKYPPLPMTAEQQRKRLLATIVAWTLGTARIQPLVIAIEDLHWADPSTLEVIQLLLEQGAKAPLLLIYTARPEFRASWPLRAHHTQLTLNRLSAHDVREMVARVVAHAALPADAVEAVVERTGGVPLFIEELTRTVLDSVDAKPAVHEIPTTLHDSLMARLDRLGPVKEIIQVASVIGHEFSWGLLRAIAATDDETLEAALKRLTDAELLFVQGIPPEASYTFKHGLIQDVAYQSLLRSRRQDYHRKIAQALEERFPEIAQAQPELLAYHYTEADLGKQAILQLQIAGQKAIQRSANVEAVSHLNKGLKLLKKMPDSPARIQQELTLQITLGTPLIATKGFASPEVERVYARARELCHQLGDVPQLFPVLWGLWVFYTARAEHSAARELAEQCLRLAENSHDPTFLVEAHHALGITLTALAEFDPALEHLEYVIVHHDPAQHGAMAFLYGQDPKVVCLSQAAWVLWIRGYPDQALKRNDEAITLGQKLSHPYSLTAALDFGAMVHQLCQDGQATRERAEAAIALSTEQEFAYWTTWGFVLRGWALTEHGQVKDGIVQIQQGVTAFRATGAEVMVPYFLGLLAEAYGKSGQSDRGLSVLDEAQAAVDHGRERWWEAELYRLKGELLLKQSGVQSLKSKDEKEAEDYFRQALDIASRQSAKSLELRAAMSLSRLWEKQGKRAEARRMLVEIYSWFTEGFDTIGLREAKMLLEEVS